MSKHRNSGVLPLMPIMNPEKIKEIKKLLRQGIPEGEIREDLKQEGYSDEDVNAVFKPHHYDMRSWYLFFWNYNYIDWPLPISYKSWDTYPGIRNTFILGLLL